MTPDLFNLYNQVFDVLINAGASEHDRNSFIYFMDDPQTREFRFMGELGFGGKFWKNGDRWYVNCYSEDENLHRLVIITAINERLYKLKKKYEGEDKKINWKEEGF